MFNNILSKYKKALLLGTGGGNDIVSATLIADYLSKAGIECDVAGVLSPGATHTFNNDNELCVNIIGDRIIKRYIKSAYRTSEITFLDNLLPSASKEVGYSVNNFIELSTKYGTENLLNSLNDFIAQEKYDVFIEVDVGGDILGRQCDNTILSPLMDYTSLYILDKVNVDSYLIEFGVGTDGELRPNGINEIFEELKNKNVLLDSTQIFISDPEIDRFKKLLEKTNTVRVGHTATMLFETLNNSSGNIHSEYYSTWQVNGKKWKNYYDVTLLESTFGKVYLFDGKKLPSLRQDTAISYASIMEQYVRLKKPEWKTELDMCHIESDDVGHVYLLTPSKQVPEDKRIEIIKAGLDFHFLNRLGGYVILLRNDAHLCGKYYIKYTNKFAIVTDHEYNFIIDGEECNPCDVVYNSIKKYERIK